MAVLAAAALVTAQPVGAAEGLAFSASAEYELIPAERRVHVTVDAAVTSLTPDSATQRFSYTGISIFAPAGATNVSAIAAGGAIGAVITESTAEYATIEVTFGQEVFYQQTYRFTVGFDIVDTGGEAGRGVRIGTAFAAFPVWAYGDLDTPANVTVLIPPDFVVNLLAGSMNETPNGGGTLLTAPVGENADSFFAYVTAEAPNARVIERLDVPVGDEIAEIELTSWPDDPEWVELVRPLIVDGIPVLSEQIGLPYPIPFRLRVSEQAFERLGYYAGVFDDQTDAIEIRYDADAFVTLHESAHIWFNGYLFEDRWIGEAFASYYAEAAAHELEISIEPFTLTADLQADEFPLNEWDEPGREDTAREDYAYAATNELGRRIATLAGPDGLRAVWRAADSSAFSYQAVGADEPELGEPTVSAGWQRLLDLLEERTGEDFDPLWIDFVVSDSDLPLLTERSRARDGYAELVEGADGWAMPRPLRLVMGAWQFELAEERMADIDEVLVLRDDIESRAAALELSEPPDLRSAFEVEGVDAAMTRGASQLAALETLDGASARLEPELSPAEWVGLFGEATPDSTMTAARAAYESGDAVEADELAGEAGAARDEATGRGRERVIGVGAALLTLDAAAMGVLLIRRRRVRLPA